MTKTLKQKNQPQLIVFLAANVFVIGGMLIGWHEVAALVKDALKGDLSAAGKMIAAPAVAGLFVGIVGWALPKALKETLIFWRIGPPRLPSREAFTKIAPADPRIDIARLRERVGELPTSPEKQNSFWYSIYRAHAKDASVEDANSAYLLYRDMAALALVLTLAAAVLTFFFGASTSTIVLFAALLTELILVTLAARNAGSRLVANVLAIEASLLGDSDPGTKRKQRTDKSRASRKRQVKSEC